MEYRILLLGMSVLSVSLEAQRYKATRLIGQENVMWFSSSKRIQKVQPFETKIPGTSIRPALQRVIRELFQQFPHEGAGGLVMINPYGQIVALGSYHSPEMKDLALLSRAVLPAASLLKMVTLSAVLRETSYDIETEIPYRYSCTALSGQVWLPISRLDRRRLPLKEAFARSCNPVFGRLAVQVGYDALKKELMQYGFFKQLGGDVMTDTSEVYFHHDKNSMLVRDLAFLGSGLGLSKISLIHAALLSVPLINGGLWRSPYLRSSLDRLEGSQILSPDLLDGLKVSMVQTVKTGTAKKFFKDPLFKDLIAQNLIGLKTGTLCRFRSRDYVMLTTGFVGKSPIGPYAFSSAVVVPARPRGGHLASKLASSLIQKVHHL